MNREAAGDPPRQQKKSRDPVDLGNQVLAAAERIPGVEGLAAFNLGAHLLRGHDQPEREVQADRERRRPLRRGERP